MFQVPQRQTILTSALTSAKSNVALGLMILLGLSGSLAQAQEMSESVQLLVPQFEAQAQSSRAPECELLNRTTTMTVESDGTKTNVVHYVIASNSNAHPDTCLRFEIDRICDRSQIAEKVAIDFTSLTSSSFYKASRTYRMTGVCQVSMNPNDVRLVRRPEDRENGVAFEQRRHFNMVTDWTEKKN